MKYSISIKLKLDTTIEREHNEAGSMSLTG